MNITPHDIDIEKNLIVLANATMLVGKVITNIMGNDISNAINSNRLTLDSVYGLAQSRFKSNLEF